MLNTKMKMISDNGRHRRQMYKRSMTLPPELANEIEQEDEQTTEQSQLIKSGTSPVLSRESSRDSDQEDEIKPVEAPIPKDKKKRTRFRNDRSHTLNPSQTLAAEQPLLSEAIMLEQCAKNGNGSGSKSHNAPSAILTKVKERIRQKVFQSSEWPNAAAIMHERRQRALDALEATLHSRREQESENIPLREMNSPGSGKLKRRRIISDPVKSEIRKAATVSAPGGKEVARSLFVKRRSISETYEDRKGGIVCSNEDLESIIYDFKKKRSPPRFRKHMRAQSLDSGRMTRAIVEAQLSVESTNTTTSSYHTDSTGNVTPVSREPAELIEKLNVPKKEIILDEVSKGSILGQLYIHNVSEKQLDTKKPAKKPPEVVYDELGQTWDVYGAEFDPNILGHAIQSHLETMMSKTVEVERRRSCAHELAKLHETLPGVKIKKTEETQPSFWLRLLCPFARPRQQVTT